jgi:hypothetical protein
MNKEYKFHIVICNFLKVENTYTTFFILKILGLCNNYEIVLLVCFEMYKCY